MIIPKKSLGQHFLNDSNIVKKIIQTAGIVPEEDIVEIGPGKGILTRQLLNCSRKVFAVEIDRQLVAYLKKEFLSFPNLEIIQGDILRIDWNLLPARFKVVANIPYQISSPLLGLLLQERKRISSMTLMVQKEVAMRMIAGPDTKEYSPLSVFIQYYATATPAFHIKNSSFTPPPRVDSTVVKITPLSESNLETLNDAYFFKVVKGAFAHRRKSIRNSLKDEGFHQNDLDEVFRELSLDSKRRGETFSLVEFSQLSNRFFEMASKGSILP
ncbi:MAG: ribosomal RNA small subunit methyltransferase A [Nitrospirae bacterium]|nr:ribosomal RNA small subunit methyltransferase A [Nitrospirota bacterium]